MKNIVLRVSLILLLITCLALISNPKNKVNPPLKSNQRTSTLVSEPGQNLLKNPGFEDIDLSTKLPSGWTTRSPREEISPVFEADISTFHSGKSSVKITSKGSPGTFGYWISPSVVIKSDGHSKEFRVVRQCFRDSNFLSKRNYLVRCFYKTTGIESVAKSIWIRVNWLNNDKKIVFTEFLSGIVNEGDWYRVEKILTAPAAASNLNIELALQWVAKGTVWFDDIDVEETTSPKQRIIVLGTSCSAPSSPSTSEKNREFYAQKISEAGRLGVDILCLGEGITVVSTDKKYADVAETIPGPTSRELGEAARKAKLYIVAGIYERDGSLIYNTALLIDRNGNIAGKYRKTHLPESEVYGGITPGNSYPVFQTDFGKVGIEICYDNFFPEVTRNLAINGAEIILCPIWGDLREQGSVWDVVARARAIDNAVYLVASMYNRKKSLIFSPYGSIIDENPGIEGLVTARVPLDIRTFEPWLSVSAYGEWKNLFLKERRPETYKELTKNPY